MSGGKHYGHVEVDVTRKDEDGGFTVTIVPVHVFPILDPANPGTITGWERREYDDVLTFDVAAAGPQADGAATDATAPVEP